MIKTVDQTTVADIFSINSDRVYRIPKYQREYTWGINDWVHSLMMSLKMTTAISLAHIFV